jgi:hypothetical protein
MTLLGRVFWFVLGLGMLIGAMLLTVQLSHATVICGGIERPDLKHSPGPVWSEEDDRLLVDAVKRQDEAERAIEEQRLLNQGRCLDGSDCRPEALAKLPKDPISEQRNTCTEYGAKHGRHFNASSENDWLLFCMQQAHFQLCENCQIDPSHNWSRHQSCSEVGPAALYDNECWKRTSEPEPLNVPSKFQDRVPW